MFHPWVRPAVGFAGYPERGFFAPSREGAVRAESGSTQLREAAFGHADLVATDGRGERKSPWIR